MPLVGPPPDPRQVTLDLGPAADPAAWAWCLGLGLALLLVGLLARRLPPLVRAFLAISGQVVLLTAPLAGVLDRVVFGAWPNTDKTGSFLFYQDGVHIRALLDPIQSLQDPALRLIGVHTGHLWVTQALDLVFTTHGAFNAQALLWPALAWLCAGLLLGETGSGRWERWILAFPFGMGLHVFRDLHWSTIEKAAVAGIPLYGWALLGAWRRGGAWTLVAGATLLASAWVNIYVGLLNGLGAALLLLVARDRRAFKAVTVSALSVLPLAAWQALLLRDAGALSSPERFLWERAALDVVSLWPPSWYRMEPWRALNLVAVGLACVGVLQERPWRWGWAFLVLLLLSLGPWLLPGVYNPVFFAAWKGIPGFWRLAKPEFLFEGAWLLVLVQAGRALTRLHLPPGHLALVHGLFLAGWLLSVRTHPAYPVFTEPVPVTRAQGWEEQVFGQ